jgi:hypothetical protein
MFERPTGKFESVVNWETTDPPANFPTWRSLSEQEKVDIISRKRKVESIQSIAQKVLE